MYFGQKPEEHVFSIEQRCLEVKNNDFEKNNYVQNKWSKIEFVDVISRWFCMVLRGEAQKT